MKNKKAAIIIASVTGILLLALVFIGFLDYEGSKPQVDPDETSKEEVRGKCAVEACIEQLTPQMTLAEANETIGFEGEKSADSDKYEWKLSEKTKIAIEYKDNLGTITATYDKAEIQDKDFKISVGYELQNQLRSGTAYTYEETVEKFNGAKGHLATKAATFKRYIWVNSDDITYSASFSDTADGKTSIISIR